MDELIPLRNDTLGRLPDGIRVPRYDRSELSPGIVHIGLGNFHRAHQAWYLHRLMDEGLAHDWAIVGAAVRAPDAAQREKLMAQDGLSLLIELDPTGKSAEVTGSMIDYLPVEEGNASLIARMAEPDIRIVSMTVTESGYYRDASGGFDADHPDIRHDAENPDRPKTVFGAMIAALRLRRDRGTGPFTGLCCDNLQGNGVVLRRTIVSLARLSDPELADWIDANCTFPNAMVDCIVPGTGPKEIALAREFGIDTLVPVTHENFRQWVIEDEFCAGRPPWEKVGVTFSDNVHAYESMKIRILNAGHQLVGEPGELLSIDTIAGCIGHPAIHGFFRKVQTTEIAEQVHAVPGMTALEYVDLIDKRFSNTAIVDQTRRIAFNGSSKHPGFLHDMVRERLEAGKPVDGLALSEAIWCRMCAGTREDGSHIEPNDPRWDELTAAAQAARSNPSVWIEQRGLYGDWARNDDFAKSFSTWLTRLHAEGVEAVLRDYAGG